MRISAKLMHLEQLISLNPNALINPTKDITVSEIITNQEALLTKNNALAFYDKNNFTSRTPDQTFIVKDKITSLKVDWNNSYCHPISELLFMQLQKKISKIIPNQKKLYSIKKHISQDKITGFPIHLVSNKAIAIAFAENMFHDYKLKSTKTPFSLIYLPDLDPSKLIKNYKYKSFIAINLENANAIILGTSYLGNIKKIPFIYLNYKLPQKNILTLHGAAHADKSGASIFLGLSGTGKTTLSLNDKKTLIADDELIWDQNGLQNIENGCYVKAYNLDKKEDYEIYNSIKKIKNKTTIFENILIDKKLNPSFDNASITENMRISFPIKNYPYYKNGKHTHPKNIFLLTADLVGILPPIALLNNQQATFWYLSGYTGKLSGTENNSKKSTHEFSRFFGKPFMFGKPELYLKLFKNKIKAHKPNIYLVNTGWIKLNNKTLTRVPLIITKTLIKKAEQNYFHPQNLQTDPIFKFKIPKKCNGIKKSILNPHDQWQNETELISAQKKLLATLQKNLKQEFPHIT